MMLLFCTAVGVLLASTPRVLYVLFSRELDSQFNCRLQKAAMPVATVLASDPNSESRGVNELNIPDEYFEVLDASGQVLQKSKNLARSELKLSRAIDPSRETFQTIERSGFGTPAGDSNSIPKKNRTAILGSLDAKPVAMTRCSLAFNGLLCGCCRLAFSNSLYFAMVRWT